MKWGKKIQLYDFKAPNLILDPKFQPNRNFRVQFPKKKRAENTDLKDTTGPTSWQISISCSSVASYGILPTEIKIQQEIKTRKTTSNQITRKFQASAPRLRKPNTIETKIKWNKKQHWRFDKMHYSNPPFPNTNQQFPINERAKTDNQIGNVPKTQRCWEEAMNQQKKKKKVKQCFIFFLLSILLTYPPTTNAV